MTSPNDNACVVRVITVVALDEATRAKALDAARKLYGENATIEEVIDPSIVGGIVLECGGKRFDASVRSQLTTLKKSLSQVGGAL